MEILRFVLQLYNKGKKCFALAKGDNANVCRVVGWLFMRIIVDCHSHGSIFAMKDFLDGHYRVNESVLVLIKGFLVLSQRNCYLNTCS